jgi:prepilin-type processing-associated H-X9-DG protein
MGGNNYGFADGHARWITSDALMAAAGTWKNPVHTAEAGRYGAGVSDETEMIEGLPTCQCLPDGYRFQ